MTRRSWHRGVYQSTTYIAVAILLLILFLTAGFFFYIPHEQAAAGRSGMPADLARQRAIWKTERPVAFRYTIRRSCFCSPQYTQPFEISERAGVSRVTVPIESTAVDPVPPDVRSIDAVFELLETAVRDADSVTVSYDAVYGFPTDIRIDWSADTIDDEDSYEIGQFIVLEH